MVFFFLRHFSPFFQTIFCLLKECYYWSVYFTSAPPCSNYCTMINKFSTIFQSTHTKSWQQRFKETMDLLCIKWIFWLEFVGNSLFFHNPFPAPILLLWASTALLLIHTLVTKKKLQRGFCFSPLGNSLALSSLTKALRFIFSYLHQRDLACTV